MRRLLIQLVLPSVLTLMPLLAALLVVVAAPASAMKFYIANVIESRLDWLILGLGAFLFAMQTLLVWRSLRWRGSSFDESSDRWLSNLAQAAEWFPMLGLIGTVTGILQTFSQIAVSPNTTANDIIRSYAPAITATGSGLFMALINILPTWVVLIGRDIILTLAGGTPGKEPRA